MFAIIAAVLFAIALLFDLFKVGSHIFDLELAGFLCIALHLAGAMAWGRRFRR